ncbi:MAG: replicative DNA helicase, partial [Bacillales bacterium]|nr:replicative DNA helicase [Bacillales bacterium]
LEAYEHKQGNTLSQFLDYLDEIGQSHIYEQRYFYDFWLIMHQRSPIQNGEIQEEQGNTLLGEALALLGTNTLTVQEGIGIIQKCERFSIQEMIITVSENDELS